MSDIDIVIAKRIASVIDETACPDCVDSVICELNGEFPNVEFFKSYEPIEQDPEETLIISFVRVRAK